MQPSNLCSISPASATKVAVAFCIFCSSLLSAQPSSKAASVKTDEPALQTLTKIETESDEATSSITARLNKAPKIETLHLEDHGTFVQVIIPNTVIPEPGKFFEGNSPFIRKVAVFQVTPTDGAIRLFTSKDAAKTKAAASVDVLSDRVIISLDHKKLTSMLGESALTDAGLEGLPRLQKISAQTADQVIAKTEVRKDAPPPSEIIQAMGAQTTTENSPQQNVAERPLGPPAPAAETSKSSELAFPVGQNTPDLRGKLTGISIFSGIMIILLVGLYVLKPRLKRRFSSQADSEPVLSMKTLATMALAPKQRLVLVQVGMDQILLAVSPDNVSFITNVASSASRQVATARSQAIAAMPFAQQLEAPSEDAREEPRATPAKQHPARNVQRPPSPSKKSMQRPLPEDLEERIQASQPPRGNANARQRSINVAIGDDGIKRLAPEPRLANQELRPQSDGQSSRPIDDITRLIREKLKNLPAI